MLARGGAWCQGFCSPIAFAGLESEDLHERSRSHAPARHRRGRGRSATKAAIWSGSRQKPKGPSRGCSIARSASGGLGPSARTGTREQVAVSCSSTAPWVTRVPISKCSTGQSSSGCTAEGSMCCCTRITCEAHPSSRTARRFMSGRLIALDRKATTESRRALAVRARSLSHFFLQSVTMIASVSAGPAANCGRFSQRVSSRALSIRLRDDETLPSASRRRSLSRPL